jgi:hypothetical protein
MSQSTYERMLLERCTTPFGLGAKDSSPYCCARSDDPCFPGQKYETPTPSRSVTSQVRVGKYLLPGYTFRYFGLIGCEGIKSVS